VSGAGLRRGNRMCGPPITIKRSKVKAVGGPPGKLILETEERGGIAWPYSWEAINREAWELIRKTHRFCFSLYHGTTNYSETRRS
jgi:hypothetical protein